MVEDINLFLCIFVYFCVFLCIFVYLSRIFGMNICI